jgi:hypothetical protein
MTMNRKLSPLAVASALLAPAPACAQAAAYFHDEMMAANEAGGDSREAARAAREKAREDREKLREAARESHEHADVWRRWADDYARDMRSSMSTAFGGRLGARTVKGAPYSADIVTEVNQTLSDGNVISRRTQGAVYRDSEGRMRQETPGDGKERSVFIQDPVEGKTVVVTPGAKHAVTAAFPKGVNTYVVNAKNRQVVRVDDTEVRIEDGKVFVNGVESPEASVKMTSKRGNDVRIENGRILINGKPLQTSPRASAGAPGAHELHGPGQVVVRTIESKEGEDGVKREEVRVQVIRGNEMPPLPPIPPTPPTSPTPPLPPIGKMSVPLPPMPPMPPMPPIPGIQTMRFESTAKLGKGMTANLGMRDFDGVKAEGKSTTWTIPAGEIGNRKPIDVVSESWYSPDLQVTVYSRYNDPRTGETVYRLANLKRGEPSPDLFKVPDDIALKSRDSEKRAK